MHNLVFSLSIYFALFITLAPTKASAYVYVYQGLVCSKGIEKYQFFFLKYGTRFSHYCESRKLVEGLPEDSENECFIDYSEVLKTQCEARMEDLKSHGFRCVEIKGHSDEYRKWNPEWVNRSDAKKPSCSDFIGKKDR